MPPHLLILINSAFVTSEYARGVGNNYNNDNLHSVSNWHTRCKMNYRHCMNGWSHIIKGVEFNYMAAKQGAHRVIHLI